MRFSDDGLLLSFSVEQGKEVITYLRREHEWKYGNGECGRGLYSPRWDRQMGEWGDRLKLPKTGPRSQYEPCFWVNPSVIYYLPDHLKISD